MQITKTEYDEMNGKALAATARAETAEAALKKATDEAAMYRKSSADYSNQITEANNMLDNMPDAPAKTADGERYGATLALSSRLAIWIAKRAK
jgi:hypothetical protein